MGDCHKRVLTLAVIIAVVVSMIPQSIPAVRFVAFGVVEGDWLNDFGLIDHGFIAGGLGFVTDVLAGRVTVDYPFEDTLPTWIADAVYRLGG